MPGKGWFSHALGYRSAFWVSLAAITWLALSPSEPEYLPEMSDILKHLSAFSYLTVLLWLAHYRERPIRPVPLWLFGYGLGLEAVQYFLPARSAELKDLLIDAAGIFAGMAVVVLLRRTRRSHGGRAKAGADLR